MLCCKPTRDLATVTIGENHIREKQVDSIRGLEVGRGFLLISRRKDAEASTLENALDGATVVAVIFEDEHTRHELGATGCITRAVSNVLWR